MNAQKKPYVNPFLTIQNNGTETIIYITNKSENCIRVTEKEHPLFSVSDINCFSDRLSKLTKEDTFCLMSEGFISGEPFNRSKILLESYAKLESPDKFHLTVMPTLNCNNDCSYCYEDHIDQPTMSGQDVRTCHEGIKKIISKKNMSSFHLNVMGGEATLVKDKTLALLSKAKNMCHDSDVEFSGSLTTNGRLLGKNNLAERLIENGIRHFQITLDGPPETHNRVRRGLKGENTFQETLDGILAVRNSKYDDILCSIRINHTLDTIIHDRPEKFFKFLAKYFAKDCRFEIYNHTAGDLGGCISKENLISPRDRHRILRKVNDIALAQGLIIKTDMFQPNGRICYAARKNAITLMPGGRLVKCTVAIDDPINQVGKMEADGTITLNENHELWVNHSCSSDSCRVAPICQGKCCPLKFLQTGRNVCPDVKTDTQFIFRQLQVQDMLEAISI